MERRDLTFRVFISSTFSDLVAERNALHNLVFPRLREFCRKHAAQFQPIDLRWGVSEEAALDQRTLNICLEELQRCQSTSLRPHFIVLLGQRYGWCPLPSQIEAGEFDNLMLLLTDHERQRFRQWYRRDENAVPAEYCLQPREGAFKEASAWTTEERGLRAILRGAIVRIGWATNDSRRLKYEASATHQEILHGALQVHDKIDHAFGFIRTIEDLPQDATARDFLDLDAQGRPDAEMRGRLDRLQAEMWAQMPNNIETYSATWNGTAPSTEHLQQLCTDVYDRLSNVIEEEIRLRDRSDPLDREAIAHGRFGEDRARNFIGREDALSGIREYVEVGNRHPLVLHGVSGVGKSALMAKAAQQRQELADGSRKSEVVVRYIGATPASSDLRALLEGLCKEITLRYRGDAASVPMDLQKLEQDFTKRLLLATSEKPLVVFLDALDQLSPADDAHQFSWLTRELPPHAKVIVSVLEDASSEEAGKQKSEVETTWDNRLAAALRGRLRAENFLRIEPLTADRGALLLTAWLAEAARTLQPSQRQEVLEKFASNGLPLYLKLAFEEARRWKSWEAQTPPGVHLSDDIPGILRDMFFRLEDGRNHGRLLVGRALGYVGAGRRGLSENELLDVLSADREVMADFIQQSPTERVKPRAQQLKTLPVLVWSRLRADLEPYVSERIADGATVLTFYHRQVGEAGRRRYLSGDNRLRSHRHLAEFFHNQDFFIESVDEQRSRAKRLPPTARPVNLRKVDELPWQRIEAAKLSREWAEVDRLFTDLYFLESKAEAGKVFDLAGDFVRALSAVRVEGFQNEILRVLVETILRNIHFIARHPTALFQCLWNDDWEQIPQDDPELNHIKPGDALSLSHLLLAWRSATPADFPRSPWVRIVGSTQEGKMKPFAVFSSDDAAVTSIAFARHGNLVVSGSEDGIVHVWDYLTGRKMRQLRHAFDTSATRGIRNVAISPDGTTVASVVSDVRLWSVATGHEICCLAEPLVFPSAIAFSADGYRLGVLGEAGLYLYEIPIGRNLGKYFIGNFSGYKTRPASIALSNDGLLIAGGAWDGTIRIWDISSKRERCVVNLGAPATGVSFSLDDGSVAGWSIDGTVRTWTLSGQELATHKGKGTAIGGDLAVLSPDHRLVVRSSGEGDVHLWRLGQESELVDLPGHEERVNALAFSPDSAAIASGTGNWEPNTFFLGERRRRRFHNPAVRLWHMPSPWPVRVIDSVRKAGQQRITGLRFNRVGTLLASGSADGSITLWDTTSWKAMLLLTGHVQKVNDLAFSPDGHLVASCCDAGFLRLWDTRTGKILSEILATVRAAMCVGFSPDGRLVAVGGYGSLQVFETDVLLGASTRHATITILPPHCATSLAFAPIGHQLAYSFDDHHIYLTSLASHERRRISTSKERHHGEIWGIGFAPNGESLVTGSSDGTMRTWDLKTGECREKIAGVGDPAAMAVGTAVHARHAIIRNGEVIVEAASTRTAVAWFGVPFQRLTTHPNGRLWCGATMQNLFSIELRET